MRSIQNSFNLAFGSKMSIFVGSNDNVVFIRTATPSEGHHVSTNTSLNKVDDGVVIRSFSRREESYSSTYIYTFDKSKFDEKKAVAWFKKYYGATDVEIIKDQWGNNGQRQGSI